MRILTPKEIDAMPKWANYYSIQNDEPYFTEYKGAQIGLCHRQVPRKPFDISEYLESDPEHPSQQPHIFEEDSCLCIDGKVSKFHAIGMAKYFKLTADDLK